MRVVNAKSFAVICDIHGNLPALEAVLEDIRGAKIDEIVVGGDVVPGPMPRETLECLLTLEIPVRFIMGNGDRIVLAKMDGIDSEEVPLSFRENIRWNAGQLGPGHKASMSTWPATLRIEIERVGTVLFCHATPRNDTEIFTRRTEESRLLRVFEGVDASLVVCGHTHMQFDRMVGSARVINAGSVGMPFGEPGAYWLEIGPAIRLRHTLYNLTTAADRIRASAYPQARDFADHNVLRPPSEEQILDAYASAELK
jgi:putative phosphoesterase